MRATPSPDTERKQRMSLDWQETIAKMARTDRKVRFTTLAHHLTVETLEHAYGQLNRKAAPGPDGIEVPQYGEALDASLQDLWERLRSQKYRCSTVRRVMIPKPNGKLRPLGIANVEDRVVQTAVKLVLEPIYEQDFKSFSYGFRPGRSTKDALEDLRKTVDAGWVSVMVEADIKGFFDNLDHGWLRKFLQHRIADRGLLRVIGKVLNAGVLQEDGSIVRSKRGAPQGGPLSPLLANIYLHYVLDLWFPWHCRRVCRGRARMVRYADDFVMCFEHREDAERIAHDLEERLAAFELELEASKTRLIEFGRHTDPKGRGRESGGHTFDFLGFTHYMRPRRATLRVARLPSRKSRNRFLQRMKEWLWKHMHASPWLHQRAIVRKLQGFYQYFGLRYCRPYLWAVRSEVQRLWLRVLRRRSQRGARLSWAKVKRRPWFGLPGVRIRRTRKRRQRSREKRPAQLSLFST